MKCVQILLLALLSCSHEPRVMDDISAGDIDILGKESCYSDNEKNAWLISLKSNSGKHIIGADIKFKGIEYKNVVKTYYDLSTQYLDTTHRYAIIFYSTDSLEAPCNLFPQQIDPPTNSKVPIVKISLVGFAGV